MKIFKTPDLQKYHKHAAGGNVCIPHLHNQHISNSFLSTLLTSICQTANQEFKMKVKFLEFKYNILYKVEIRWIQVTTELQGNHYGNKIRKEM